MTRVAFAASIALASTPVQAAPVSTDTDEPSSYTSTVVFQTPDQWNEVSPFQVVTPEISAPVAGESRATQKEREAAIAASQTRKSVVSSTKVASVDPSTLSGNLKLAYDMALAAYGSEAEAQAFVWIVKKESGGNHLAVNKSSYAGGLMQSINPMAYTGQKANKKAMGYEGVVSYLESETTPEMQIAWGIRYMSRYGNSPLKAVDHHRIHNWY